mgnify:CR=1 FL=1
MYKEDELILESLEKTTCKVDGSYQVRLIWKDFNTNLPDNRAVAERRLHLLEKRLESDPELNAKYRKAIDDDLQKGYIKKLPEQELSQANRRVWYLAYYPVLSPHKLGKVRRVSDAAANYQGTSLNDQFSSGPGLLNSLVGILMRFRQESKAMSAEIETMFNQVTVPEEDQSVLRFVWRRTQGTRWTCTNMLVTSFVPSVPQHVLITHCNEQLKIIRIPFPWKQKWWRGTFTWTIYLNRSHPYSKHAAFKLD